MTDRRGLTTGDLARTDDFDQALARDADGGATKAQPLEPLLSGDDAERFRSRWRELQASFVDEPQQVVERADELVAELMSKLAETFAEERRGLEEQWSRGDNVSTEDLRVALTHYRSFFERLLTT